MSHPLRPINLLLVEDNEGDIVLTREALESKQIPKQLHVCKNGVDAIQFLETCSNADPLSVPEMIILDINLPKKNGHEVLQFIKAHQGLAHIPVIILTTSSSESDISMAYQLKAKTYITKPLDADGFNIIADKLEQIWRELVLTSEHEN